MNIKSYIKTQKIAPIVLIIVGIIIAYHFGFIDNPKSYSLPQQPEDVAELAKRLSEKDRTLLAQYYVRHSLAKMFGGNDSNSSITIGQAIDEQKSWADKRSGNEAAQKELSKKTNAERQVKIDEINKMITISYLGKKLEKSGYRDFIEIRIVYQNNSKKDISGIKGKYLFKDIFGDVILRMNSGMNHTIKVGEKYTEIGHGINYNEFMDDQKNFLATPDEKIRFEFVPQIIVFTDGTKLEIPSDD